MFLANPSKSFMSRVFGFFSMMMGEVFDVL
jgi:hypothetical protein